MGFAALLSLAMMGQIAGNPVTIPQGTLLVSWSNSPTGPGAGLMDGWYRSPAGPWTWFPAADREDGTCDWMILQYGAGAVPELTLNTRGGGIFAVGGQKFKITSSAQTPFLLEFTATSAIGTGWINPLFGSNLVVTITQP